MKFENCEHKAFFGTYSFDDKGGQSFTGFCLDCNWNMFKDYKTGKWKKTKWFTKKSSDELREFYEMRGMLKEESIPEQASEEK